MTPADLIGARLDLSTDEVMSVLDAANVVAYSLEMNLDQLYEDFADMELSELDAGDPPGTTEKQVREAIDSFLD